MTPEEIVSTITERVKDTANVDVVFGDPIEAGGVTIIPVAAVKVAGGGGGGKGRSVALPIEGEEQAEGGMGLGLQITAKPLGYIQVTDGTARLVPIVDVTKIAIGSMVACTLAVMFIGRMMYRRAKMREA